MLKILPLCVCSLFAILLIAFLNTIVQTPAVNAETKTTALNAPTKPSTKNLFLGLDVILRSPLSTFTIPRRASLADCSGIAATIVVPEDAPTDLGVGAYLKDQDGIWFQLPHPHRLSAGQHELYFPIGSLESWHSEPAGIEWNNYRLGLAKEFGLYFWSSTQSSIPIHIPQLQAVPIPSVDSKQDHAQALRIISLDNYDALSQSCALETGKRWELHCAPVELPDNPFAASLIKIDALITDAQGKQQSYAGFYCQPTALRDGGNQELDSIHQPGYFAIRYRPQKSGRYQLQLQLQSGSQTFNMQMPDLVVSGKPFSDYVYTDASDTRFFKTGHAENEEFFWPLGINLRSVNDSRGHENTNCIPTPTRGSLSYQDYLTRYSNAGANCAEIWMCSWNLALEWKKEWPGFYGTGFYNQANAERLDRILDMAYAKNMRVILVLNNHGQASSRVDSEWDLHPYNRRNGGFLRRASEIYTDARAREAQESLRRYIVARYADHPAIMCWKLWTEQDLTDVGLETRNPWQGRTNQILHDWHFQAINHLKSLDHYQHPVVTHWSSDYTIVDRQVAAIPQLDAVFIDAYHHRVPGHQLLADVLSSSIDNSERGLARLNKPILCTEFGGTPMACPEPQLLAEHLSGPWAALCSGHAGSPLLWWFEWVDQRNIWQPYRAVSQFMNGEDLRGSDARSVSLPVRSVYPTWNRNWARQGRLLGYLLDYHWGYSGSQAALIDDAVIVLGQQIRAGKLNLEWWDASLGQIIQRKEIDHHGGLLELSAPPFRRHLAYKLIRQD